jgi:hypothetical protein
MHCFRCDEPGCGVIAEQGTITGGTPVGWDIKFVQIYEESAKKELTHTRHYCPTCKAARKERESR